MTELRKHHHFLRLINLEQINSSFIKKWKMKKDKKESLHMSSIKSEEFKRKVKT